MSSSPELSSPVGFYFGITVFLLDKTKKKGAYYECH
jgi:hypothetical protein